MRKVQLQALPAPTAPVAPPSRALPPSLTYILNEAQRELGYGLQGHQVEQELSNSRLVSLIETVANRLGFEVSNEERDAVIAELEREQKPFGILQELVDNEQISDIVVTNYSKIAVQQGRKNLTTGLAFPTPQIYEAFVEKLLSRCGTTYSNKKPIADGMLGGLARIHAVHPSICESGPYLTIRLNRFSRVTVCDLEKRGMAPPPIMDYLQGLIFLGHTILIVGEVGTGKTTLARALAASIPKDESILVIEDTPEIVLEHPHVRYLTTREANSEGAGRITPGECIRAGMRMAMNRIVFGEMRDPEAAESFIDVCASGHPGLSTIHARNALEAVARLELFLGRAQRGASRHVFTEQVANSVHAIVHLDICKITGRRRVIEVREIGPVADGVLRTRELFHYQPASGLPSWRVVSRASVFREPLERIEKPVVLSALPNVIELPPEVLLQELNDSKRAA